ncbi:hypothetical protein ABEG17_03025 [Pedococcus sp. KACC 23699]|uniref:Glycosyltransferase RgtA/B/C/D-like domain-containing protein n=1 Tax=Pedococcus sp. KACC 23699 TaxID=3149228 RepID=A0AAU7JVL6_9MICO
MPSRDRDDATSSGVEGLARSISAVPEAFVCLTALATAVGVIAAWAGLRPLASAGTSRAIVLALVLFALVFTSHRLRAGEHPVQSLLPALPALVLVGYGLVVRVLSPGERAEWFLGGDHVRHLLFVADERATGSLDYAVQSYPRGWHTLVATVWAATGAQLDGAGLRSLVDLMSTAVWLLPALLSLVTGSLAVEVARRYGAGRTEWSVAGLGAAAAVLLPSFLANYQALGFENSYVGAIVLAVLAKQVVVVDESRALRAAFVAVAGVVVCAHSWQLLLPTAGVAYLYLAWPVVRRGKARDRLALAVASVLGAAVSLPAMLAVFTVIGIQHATDSGVRAPVPVALLVAGVACASGVAYRRPRDGSLRTLLAIVVLPSVTAVAVAMRVGIPLSDYYPSKLLWHSAVLGLSPLAVVVVRGWAVLGERADSMLARAARGLGGVTGALLLAYALISPAGAFVGAWSSTRGPVTLGAITSPGAGDAQVVWLGAVGDDTIGRVLLDFYRIPDTYRTPQPPLDVAEECELLHAAKRPAVLSNRPGSEVRARYACVPALEVVPVLR